MASTIPDPGSLDALARCERFPRSAAYDPRWVAANLMGPHVLWMTEYLCEVMDLRPGMRVLDLGCGRALSSIFLAREFKVEVWAVDLHVPAEGNRRRIEKAGCAEAVHPVQADARSLRFEREQFDRIVSVDAYHYFGTDDLYLGGLMQLLRRGGRLGIAVPGLTREIGDAIPAELAADWPWEFCSFHSAAWWREHWAKTGLVDPLAAEALPDGWRYWLRTEDLCAAAGARTWPEERRMIERDAGRTLTLLRATCERRREPKYRD